MGYLRMTTTIKSKTKNMLKDLNLSDDFDNAKNNYRPNSAYRYTKQQGFINAKDILSAIESDKKKVGKL